MRPITSLLPARLLAGAALMMTLAACSANSAAQLPATATTAPAAALVPAAAASATATTPVAAGTQTAAATAATAKLNLNTASPSAFLKVPGVGDRMVREFQEYRPYTSIQQFRREIGKYVDAAQVTDYEKYVYVPIVANTADAATLQQIAGLDATEATALIASRPFASNDAFLVKLAPYVSEAQLAVAKTYLSQ
ncbi:MAG: helix-hairpin-helix domain-containing protein [Chloroflexi bacterium]|nr:helix-hairpin-helix domain-containing protein [Chloroflexota bacterium]